jgi:hypothetical protein
MDKLYWVIVIVLSLGLCSCGNKQQKKEQKETVVGNDKDEHGCIASAGYVWSEVQKDCIRLWEKGIRMQNVANDSQTAYIVFSPDSTKLELFFSDDRPNEILDRRSLPSGGYAWNVEDDDTKNVRLNQGSWTISQRNKLIYKKWVEPEKPVHDDIR